MPLLLLSISPSYYWSFSLRLFSPMAIWRVYLAFTSFLYDSPRFSINSSYSWILSKYSSSIFSALSRSNAIPLFSISRLYIFRLAYSKLSCKFSSSSCLSLRSLSISRTDAAVLGSCLVVGVMGEFRLDDLLDFMSSLRSFNFSCNSFKQFYYSCTWFLSSCSRSSPLFNSFSSS